MDEVVGEELGEGFGELGGCDVVLVEQNAVEADGACRAAAYDAGWKTLEPEVAAFEHDNAQALADEEAGWEQLVSQA